MKKTISLIMAVLMIMTAFTCFNAGAVVANNGTLDFSGATADNIFGDLVKWNGFVLNDTIGLIDVEGTFATGNDFSSQNSFSVNLGNFGGAADDTDEITFLVGNNVNIGGYGTVIGNTAVGSPEGNDYKLTNRTAQGTTNGEYQVVDSSKYFEDAKQTAINANKAFSSLAPNSTCTSAWGSYNFAGNPDVDTVVYELDDTLFDCFSFNFNMEEGQTVIVNLTAEDLITFKYGCVTINGNRATDYLRNNSGRIVLNVVNGADISYIGTELYGIIVAPESTLTAENGNICRTTIVNNLVVKYGFELHLDGRNNALPAISVPSVEPETEPTTEEVTEAPETEPTTEEVTEAPETEPTTEEVTEAPETEPTTEEVTEAPETEPTTEEVTEAPETEPTTEEVTEAPETEPTTAEVTEAPTEPATQAETVKLRVETPLKMAVKFEDGEVYYNKDEVEIEVGKEYHFQMGTVNWDNGILDDENGITGSVVYTVEVVHSKEFEELKKEALQDPDRYTVKGMDIIDNYSKKITINCDAENFHLETDVNNFFMAYRFHFSKGDYNKQTGIKNVVNTPLESLSVNLPLGATIQCDAYKAYELIDSANVLITRNSGEGIYNDVYLTCVNDYYWNY